MTATTLTATVLEVEGIPVSPGIYKDPSCGGHSGPYFLFSGQVVLTPNGKGYMAEIKGIASDRDGNQSAISMAGPLNSKGQWVTSHPWGSLGFHPVQLGGPYPPHLGWHEAGQARDASYVKHFAIPSTKQIQGCEIQGEVTPL